MKALYRTIVIQFFVAFVCIVTFAPFAHAVPSNTPLDCPSVIAVPGGYRLTENSMCVDGFSWRESNKFFSLNGFTLTMSNFALDGNRLTMRNGTVRLNGQIRNSFQSGATLSNLTIIGGPSSSQFSLEAGSDFTVKNCTISNFPGIALSFFFGDRGTVKNSVFIGNGTGISIQKSSGVLIENNRFVRNERGVNLWDEDGAGVNNNTIRRNSFQTNGVGINMLALPFFPVPELFMSMQGNRIDGNRIDRSSSSGLHIELICDGNASAINCAGQDTLVSRNQFDRNGFESGASEPDDDDGVFAQAHFRESGESYSPGLAGVTLANNRADQNADRGFDVDGVTDGGRNTAKSNGNPEQCDGLACRRQYSSPAGISLKTTVPNVLESIALEAVLEAPLPTDQVRHQ